MSIEDKLNKEWKKFADDLWNNNKPLPDEFAKLLQENMWDLYGREDLAQPEMYETHNLTQEG